MSNLPRLALIIISLLLICDAFFVSYAVGLNVRSIKLDPGEAKKSDRINASTYTAEDSKLNDSTKDAYSKEQSKSASTELKTASASGSSVSINTSGTQSDSVSVSTDSSSISVETPQVKIDTKVDDTSTSAKNFKDLDKTEERLVDSLKAAADAGVLEKSKDELFYPNKPVTRSDFTRWMVRIKQIPLVSNVEPSYLDVKPDNPYFREIETATSANMVKGYPIRGSKDKNFKPDQNITRQEFAALYGTFSGKRSRAEKLNAEKIDEYLQYDPDKSKIARRGYKDEGQIDDWARKWVAVAQQAGVVEQAFDCNPGSRKEERRFLHPQKQMTRAESVNILVKLFGLTASKTVKSDLNKKSEGEK